MAKPKQIDPGKHTPFMTTEHFTLQSAAGIINGEIVARVNLYFLTLSSLIVALAFLAQLAQIGEVLFFFALVAFPALLILGFTSFARIVQLGSVANDTNLQIADLIEHNIGWRRAFPHVRPDRAVAWGAAGFDVMQANGDYAEWRVAGKISRQGDQEAAPVGLRGSISGVEV